MSSWVALGVAQDDDPFEQLGGFQVSGEEATAEELEAFRLTQAGRHIKAREIAARVVRDNPRSFVGHFVLGQVQHYGEGNFPRALYHLDTALHLFEAQVGREPTPDQPWRWHSRILLELAQTHGDLEHHIEKIAYITRYNELYDPDLIAERAWPLMKLGRFSEARLVAEQGLTDGDPRQHEIALNALCAIEFEAGNDGASYVACEEAMRFGQEQPGGANSVDLTNFAEAARSMFRLDEAERAGLEATRAPVAWYGNPWIELAELYTREGRIPEALHALKQVSRYRAERPPHVSDSDRNEGRRAVSSFLLVVGRPQAALEITEKALVAPDRRAHNSRDPNQDLAIAALLHRRAERMVAEMALERATLRDPVDLVEALWEAASARLAAFASERKIAGLLADDALLVGTFRIGTAKSAIIPPWLVGELVDVVGAGVVMEATRRARSRDRRPGSGAYYDAFQAEAALAGGDAERATELATRALIGLGEAEALLRARMRATLAESYRRRGDRARATAAYEAAMLVDPGVLRRMELSVPLLVRAGEGGIAADVAARITSSPRFDDEGWGLELVVDADQVCLMGASGSVLGCAEAADSGADRARDLAMAFHATALAPRVDMSQADINSLDGSNLVGRDPLEDMLDSNP